MARQIRCHFDPYRSVHKKWHEVRLKIQTLFRNGPASRPAHRMIEDQELKEPFDPFLIIPVLNNISVM